MKERLRLLLITSNPGKVEEMNAWAREITRAGPAEESTSVGVEFVQRDLGYPEIQADTLEEVVDFALGYILSNHDFAGFDGFVIEDSGLFIDALGGFPGVYSAYVYRTLGNDGILRLLDGISGGKRRAVFISVIGAHVCSERIFVRGECPGVISVEKRGAGGFGYDPIFIPGGETRTFAEMDAVEKNRFSHRGRALENFLMALQV